MTGCDKMLTSTSHSSIFLQQMEFFSSELLKTTTYTLFAFFTIPPLSSLLTGVQTEVLVNFLISY